MRDTYLIGIDIGGTHIRIGSMLNNGEVEHFKKVSSKTILTGKNPAFALADFIGEYINKDLAGNTVSALAIGFPSTPSMGLELDCILEPE
jgi:allose kinase